MKIELSEEQQDELRDNMVYEIHKNLLMLKVLKQIRLEEMWGEINES